MMEQLSLFGERSTFDIITEWIVKRYESVNWTKWKPNFDEFLRNEFSTHCGGTADETLKREGWSWYEFSPKGLELVDFNTLIKDGTDWRTELIPKAKILKAFGIKDDGKDVLKDEDSCYGG